jgi:hypothetical protein
MAVGQQQLFQRRGWVRRRLLGKQLDCPANRHSSYSQDCSTQEFSFVPRVLHFNSDGCKLQDECNDVVESGLRGLWEADYERMFAFGGKCGSRDEYFHGWVTIDARVNV